MILKNTINCLDGGQTCYVAVLLTSTTSRLLQTFLLLLLLLLLLFQDYATNPEGWDHVWEVTPKSAAFKGNKDGTSGR